METRREDLVCVDNAVLRIASVLLRNVVALVFMSYFFAPNTSSTRSTSVK